jgi:hypothetical protein
MFFVTDISDKGKKDILTKREGAKGMSWMSHYSLLFGLEWASHVHSEPLDLELVRHVQVQNYHQTF